MRFLIGNFNVACGFAKGLQGKLAEMCRVAKLETC